MLGCVMTLDEALEVAKTAKVDVEERADGSWAICGTRRAMEAVATLVHYAAFSRPPKCEPHYVFVEEGEQRPSKGWQSEYARQKICVACAPGPCITPNACWPEKTR